MAVTRGKREYHALYQQIYDRLRKRSLRKKDAYQQVMFSAKYGLVSDEVIDAVFEDRIRFYGLKIQGDVAHAAYVRGVRDALQACDEMGQVE